MNIRNFQKKDTDAVRFICLNSDGPCDIGAEGQHFLLTTYCDYYIECEPECCFVATDDKDRAIGYILCAKDFDIFYTRFMRDYYTRIPEEDTLRRGYAIDSVKEHKKYKMPYPAHLHIDILPEYQRMGAGHRLMDALLNELKKLKVKGIMLTVGTGNLKGKSFYEKYGFKLIETTSEGNIFGMTL